VDVDVEAMLGTLGHRGPEAEGVFRRGRASLGHRLLSIVGEGEQPLIGCRDDFVLVCNGEVYNHAELKRELEGHRFRTTLDVEAILHLVEENYAGDLAGAVKDVLPRLDGDYAFAVYHRGEIVLARDPVGVKPLYHTDSAFASERKALGVPFPRIRRLSPGCVMPLGGREIRAVQLSGKTVESPVEELEAALERAVEKRTRDVNVGLLFSAGLDSSLLAWIMRDMGRGDNLTLYTSGIEGCIDLEYVSRVEGEFQVRTRLIGLEELEEYVRRVVYAVEDWDPMKVSIALPVYAACELAHEDGLKVVLSGQGADELFAGYQRYLSMDTAALEKALRRDLRRIAEVNLERDDAAAMACSVELRVPYLDRDVVEAALGTPAEYKIKDGRRKHILRLLARRKGVPDFIVNRGKKAIQYATGVENALKKMARKDGKTLAGFLREVYEEVFPWR
jgi:asparagine synthase (glutamine-hydrolysing)